MGVKSQKIYTGAVSIVFLLFLLLPLAFFFIGSHKETSTAEKRKLAILPQIGASIEEITGFPEKFNIYYSDHFGFRDKLIKSYNGFLLRFFQVAPSKFVIKGKDGWFFYTGESVIEDYFGQRKNNLVALEKHASLLEDRRDWLAGLGIKYLVVPVPNKITVYDANLPFRVRQNRGISFYEQFISFLKDEKGFTNVIDLYSFFQEKKQDQQVYFKTDTHWTNEGAYLAFNQIIEHLSRWFPDLRPVTEKELFRKDVIFGGDLTFLMHNRGIVKENVAIVEPVTPCGTKKSQPFVSLSGLKDDIQKTLLQNGCPEEKLTALVVHDSFGYSLQRFLNKRFKKVIYSSKNNFSELQELIARERPDVLLEVMVARNIGRTLVPDPDLSRGQALETFIAAEKKQLLLNGSSNLHQVLMQNDVQIENHDSGLLLEATGNDPFFVVPFTPDKREGRYIVEVVLDAPADTLFTLYFTTASNTKEIQPDQLVQRKIMKGDNRLFFRLPHPEVTGLIRIDPGMKKGNYLLRSLTVKTVAY